MKIESLRIQELYEKIELDFDKFVTRTKFEIDKINQKDKFMKAQELKKQGASNGNV